MSNRQIYLSLLSSVFLFGSTQALIAMDSLSDGEETKLHFSAHSSLSLSEDESTEENKVVITNEDKENFKLITTVQNPLLETNAQFDKIQNLLNAPLKVELSYAKYLTLKNQKEEGDANSSMFIGLLKNGTKVVIKRNKYFNSSKEEIKTHYLLTEAISELIAPQIARDYFDVPTLPPVVFIGDKKHFEVRQYFIEGEPPEEEDEEKDNKRRMEFSKELFLHPESFNRPPGFIDLSIIKDYFFDDLGSDSDSSDEENDFDSSDEEIRMQQQKSLDRMQQQKSLDTFVKNLDTEWLKTHKAFDIGHLRLFDLFIAAEDRNSTQHLFIPCTNTQDNKQKWAYFGIDYAETYYDFNKGIIELSDAESEEESGEESGELSDKEEPRLIAPLSAINKIKRVHGKFRSRFKEAEKLCPKYYNDTYFKAFEEYHKKLLNRLDGIKL